MGDKTGIEWTNATWNPLAGCSLVSPGCTNCYAMGFANRLLDKPGSHYEGTTQRVNGKAVWTGKVNRAPDSILTQPLRWKRPRMVFVNSMSDLFHESVPFEWVDEIFAVMALCPQHTFQILTKRPDRMREYCNGKIKDGVVINNEAIYNAIGPVDFKTRYGFRAENGELDAYCEGGPWTYPLPNVWLGVSVEDQRRAHDRIRDLLNTPAAVRFLSMEPLIGAVDLNAIHAPAKKDPDRVPMVAETCLYTAADRPAILPMHDRNKIDWVIVGGESGPDARPMHPDWVRLVRDQCNTAGVPFFFKQWGNHYPMGGWPCRGEKTAVHVSGRVDTFTDSFPPDGWVATVRMDKKKAGRELDGRTWDEMPEGGLL